ncbi:MAG: hypothetical protein K2X27_23590, partial [Candidatus Obscuribacterales bacterium]|nr:hypothetical protein [Candidatus Obscuribacterales bacterium]
KNGKVAAVPAVFTPDAGNMMDNQMPLSVLSILAANKQIPASLQARIAWTSWVRAVLIGDDAAAKKLAALMRPFNKAKWSLIDSYLAANTADSRKFAAVFLMLQFSSANPNPGFGTANPDTYGDETGWWWSAAPIAKYETDNGPWSIEGIDADFLTAAQKAQAGKELAALKTVKAAPSYLAQAVLDYAAKYPADSRIPQALHFAVKATHYGITDNLSSALSKKCFQLLHSKYKSSPWTAKTPYYY